MTGPSRPGGSLLSSKVTVRVERLPRHCQHARPEFLCGVFQPGPVKGPGMRVSTCPRRKRVPAGAAAAARPGRVSGPQSAGHRTGLLAATQAPAIRGWCLLLRIVGLTLVHAAMRGPSTASVRHSPATGTSAPHPDTAPLPAHTARPASWRAARPGQRWTCCTQARAFNRTQDTPHPACPHGFRALDGCVCATTISTA